MKNILSKIKIDYSTYILILVGLLAGYIKNIFILLLIVIIHELGHVFFFYLFNIRVESITIYPYGGMSVVTKKLHERIYKDLLISVGGILFQVLLYFIFTNLYNSNLIAFSTYKLFKMYNFSILVFNLIPIIPLDGSKFLFSLFSKYLSYKDSYIMMIIIGSVSLIVFVIYNFVYKLNDLILYIFLLYELLLVIKNYKYIMNRFYLERVLYDHYYNGIINNELDIDKLRIDKFYFFKDENRFVNEKDYIKRRYY